VSPAAPIADTLGAFCADRSVHIAGAANGPLAGWRCGVKDLFHLAGHGTGFGHPLWLGSHPVPDATALAVQRLLDAGATVVGKTVCDELCYSLNGVNQHHGTPVNSNAPGCIPGGSSSGSASAVAGGLVDFALGSDTGGSVRVPASYCGILGMRPTFDAVPLDGAVPFAPSYDTAGWFAATPEMLLAVGRVLLADASAAPRAGPLLVATDAFDRADPAAAAALRDTLAGIGSAFDGSRPVTVAPDGLDAWMNTFRVLQGAQIWATHRDWLASLGPDFGAGIRERFQWVSTITADMVAQADAHRLRITAGLDALLQGNAVLALPTTPGGAPLIDTPVPALEAWRNRALGLLCIAGHAGLPQINLPLARVDGRPVGLSLVAARGNDLLLLDLACRLRHALRTGPVRPSA
jgi:amidase